MFTTIDDSSYRLNFDPDKKDEIYYTLKEHPFKKISKIPKFGCKK